MIHLINLKISLSEEKYGIVDFRSKVQYLTSAGLYGSYILESYTNKDLEELGAYLREDRNKLFTYSGLDLVAKRYLIKTFEGEYIECLWEFLCILPLERKIKFLLPKNYMIFYHN